MWEDWVISSLTQSLSISKYQESGLYPKQHQVWLKKIKSKLREIRIFLFCSAFLVVYSYTNTRHVNAKVLLKCWNVLDASLSQIYFVALCHAKNLRWIGLQPDLANFCLLLIDNYKRRANYHTTKQANKNKKTLHL